ncbi:G2/M phase-specific E3 ubiquitin-protein ligase-like [Lissotriton helveticus]
MFTDSSGNSEGAVDFGGPTREFLRLLMHHLQHTKLFEGPENRKTLSCDAQGMRNDDYYHAGQALAVSLVHGGTAPNFVSPVLYQCLVSDAKNANCSLVDVVDPDTRDMLQEIEDASSLETLQGLIQKHSTILSVAGCFRPLKSLNDKKELLEDIINWYIVGRTVPSLVRLKEGLKTLGVLQAMEIHKQLFEEAFIWVEHAITTDIINGMFNIQFSSFGSNHRLQEEHIIGYWRDYLQDSEGK